MADTAHKIHLLGLKILTIVSLVGLTLETIADISGIITNTHPITHVVLLSTLTLAFGGLWRFSKRNPGIGIKYTVPVLLLAIYSIAVNAALNNLGFGIGVFSVLFGSIVLAFIKSPRFSAVVYFSALGLSSVLYALFGDREYVVTIHNEILYLVLSTATWFVAAMLSEEQAASKRELTHKNEALEDALASSRVENELEELAEMTDYGYRWVFNLEDQLIRPDRTMAKWHGGWEGGKWYPIHELLHMVPPELHEILGQQIAEAAQQGSQNPDYLLNTTHPLFRHDINKTIWIKVLAKVTNINGKLHLIGKSLDVTDEIEAQQSLKRQLTLADILQSTNIVAQWRFYPEDMTVMWDETLCEWTNMGAKPGERISYINMRQTITDPVELEKFNKDVSEGINALLIEKSIDEFTFIHKIWDRTVQSIARRIELDGDLALVGYSIDISETVNAQKALQKANEIEYQRELVMAGAKFGYKWIVDLDRLQILPDTYMAEIHPGHIEPGKWYPFNIIYDWTPPEYYAMVKKDTDDYRRAIKRGEDPVLDVIHPHYDVTTDTVRWFNVRGQAKQIDGKWYLIGITYDVTELRNRQTSLEEANVKIEEALAELEQKRQYEKQMLAVIGHELRTPAAMLRMVIDEMIDMGDGMVPKLRETVDHMVEVLNDLKNVANPKQQLENDNETVNICNAVEGALQYVRPIADGTDIRLNYTPPSIVCDHKLKMSPNAIRQILTNLCKNAIKHSSCTHINISMDLHPHEDQKGVDVVMRVRDNGVGIPVDERSTLFVPFIRGRQTMAEGTGLGLSIIKGIAESYDGTIEYTPNEPSGSCFTVRLTLFVAEEKKLKYDPHYVNMLEGKKVLVAEDNMTIRLLTKKMLENQGAMVVAATNGKEAYDRLVQKEFFNIILSDIFMPEMDGYQLATSARGIGFKGPIIGCTAATIGEETDKMIKSGANRCLEKPLNIVKLNKALAEYYADLDTNIKNDV